MCHGRFSREVDMDDKVLVFLDGSAERAAVHCQRMSEEDRSRTFWVRTVNETLEILDNYRERLEVVSLEHDLGEESYVHSGSPDSGMEVVRWLEKHHPLEYAHVRFIVHSWNEIAGVKMVRRLTTAGFRVEYKPFGLGNK